MDFTSLHPFVRSTIINKIHGTITGSALGDTVGLYTEFFPKSQCHEIYPSGRFSLVEPATVPHGDHHRDKFEACAWTDDTDHALLILLSYLRNKRQLLPQDFAARLLSWAEQGLRCLDRLPLGLGNTVSTVILSKGYVDAPTDAARAFWLRGGKNVAANGALMRTHPLGVMTLPHKSREERYTTAMAFAQTTHADPRCIVSCCLATAAIAEIISGELLSEADLDALINHAYHWVAKEYRPDPELTDAGLQKEEYDKHVFAKTFEELELDGLRKIGYTYKCLGSGILSLRMAMRQPPTALNVFEDIMTELVMEGGDADTNGACAGALLGAWVGFSKLPTSWSGGMKHREWLVEKTNALCQVVGVANGGYDCESDQDTLTDKERGLLDRATLEKREIDLVTKIMTRDKERSDRSGQKKSKSGGIGRFFS